MNAVPRASLVPRPVPRPAPAHAARPRLVSLHSVDYEVDEAPTSTPPPLPKRDASLIAQKMARLDARGDALQAAAYTLDALVTVIPCALAVAHFFDPARNDFIVVAARGECADDVVLRRTAANDPLLRVVCPMNKAFSWNDLENAPTRSLARFASLPRVRRVLSAPAAHAGAPLGALELVERLDGEPFGFSDEGTVDHAARLLGAFLAARGAVLDVARIARAAF